LKRRARRKWKKFSPNIGQVLHELLQQKVISSKQKIFIMF
jgi:hypothetical protein